MPRIFAFVLTALLNVAAAYGQSSTPSGVWLHPNKRIQVEIASCGATLCGRMVWFRWPNDAGGRPLVDFKNSNPALRARPLLGLMVVHALLRTGEHSWEGKIYNPDDGIEYDAVMTVQTDGTLQVRAYVIVPALGKTLIWSRVHR